MANKQVHFVHQDKPVEGQSIADVAAFDADGNPVDIGGMKKGAAVADATGDNPTKAEYNALLASLRAAGIIASS
jgi:poly-beta-hydroxyalkanoate depolymerase